MTDEIFELKIKDAVCEMARQELAAIPFDQELRKRYVLTDEFYERMNILILSFEKKAARKERRFRFFISVAAALLLLFLWRPEILVQAKNLLVEWFEDHVLFHFVSDDPEAVHYQLQYIPEGYRIVYDDFNENLGFITCIDGSGDSLELVYTFGDNGAGFDNEDKTFRIIYEDGITFYYLEAVDGEKNTLIWNNDGVSYSLISSLDYEELQWVRSGIIPAE